MLIIHLEDISRPANKGSPMLRRSPPPPPSVTEPRHDVVPPPVTSRTGGGGGPLGAFWTTQHGKDSVVVDDTKPKFDEEPTSNSSSRHDKSRPDRPVQKIVYRTSDNRPVDGPSKDFEINFFDNSDHVTERPRSSKSDTTPAFQGDAFNAFVAEFNTNKISSVSNSKKSGNDELLEAEVERLKEQLKQVNVEKAEITSKYEKLSAICRSQRQELQELKQALASRTPPPNQDAPKNQTSAGIQLSSTPPV